MGTAVGRALPRVLRVLCHACLSLSLCLPPDALPSLARARAQTAELHVVAGAPTQQFVRAAYSIETSDAERVGVDQVAKILPGGGKAAGSEQRACCVGLACVARLLALLGRGCLLCWKGRGRRRAVASDDDDNP